MDGAGVAASVQQSDEEGETNGEEAGQLAEGMLVAVDGGDDAFAEVSGIGSHEAPPLLVNPLRLL